MASLEKYYNAEMGTILWAMISTLIFGLGTIYFSYFFITDTGEWKKGGGDPLGYAFAQIFFVFLIFITVLVVTNFICSIFLLVGVLRKGACLVRVYYIFGVVKIIILSLIAALILIVAISDFGLLITIPIMAIMLLIIGVYSQILRMVNLTYLKYKNELATPVEYTHRVIV